MRQVIAVLMVIAPGLDGAWCAQASSGGASPAGNPVRNVYYGDLHLHTKLSYDGRASTTLDEAYRFGRGQSIPYMGHQVRRQWALDFMAVTDHAEWIGVQDELRRRIGDGAKNVTQDVTQEYRDVPAADRDIGTYWELLDRILARRRLPDMAALSRSAWGRVIEAANAHYRPGVFTTFIG